MQRISATSVLVLVSLFVSQGSAHAAGGSFSEPGLAFAMLHLPLLCTALLLLRMALDRSRRRELKAPLIFFLSYLGVTGGLWTQTLLGGGSNASALLVLVLMFLAPWPVFIILFLLYGRAPRNEP